MRRAVVQGDPASSRRCSASGYFAFAASTRPVPNHPPGGVRLAEVFKWHYDSRVSGTSLRSAKPSTAALVGPIHPEVAAWALMAVGETIGLRWIVSNT